MNQKLLKLFLSLTIIFLLVKAETTKSEPEISDLDGTKLEEVLDSNEHVVVLFLEKGKTEKHQDYLDFLKKILPKFQEDFPNGLIGKVEISDATQLPRYYRFTEYPALAYFHKGKKNIFNKEFSPETFLSWASNLSKTKIVNLKGQADFDQFLQEDSSYPKLVAFYRQEDESELKVIKELVSKDHLRTFDIYKVGLCLEDCELKHNNISFSRPSLVLFREYDKESPTALKKKGLDDILDVLEFVNKESVMPVLDLDEVNVTKLFAGYAPTGMILFVDPLEDNEKILKDFEASALHNRKEDLYYERVLHSVFRFDDQWEEIKFFFSQYNRSKLPKLFITHLTDEGITKYEFKKEQINFEEIRNFLEDFRKKNLDRMLISEEIPDNEGKVIKKLVGNNFQKEVVGTKENFVVLFCDDPNSDSSKLVMKLFDLVKDKLTAESSSPNGGAEALNKLKFGYIDMLKNEVMYRSFTKYPQVLLYMKGKKSRPNEYDLPLTPKAFVAWLNSMLPELQLSMTDSEEKSFMEEKYSPVEKEEYAKMKRILDQQKEILDEEMKKIEEAEQLKKAQEKVKSEEKKEETPEVLSLGGPSVDLSKSTVKQEESQKEVPQAKPKEAKKKSEVNKDL